MGIFLVLITAFFPGSFDSYFRVGIFEEGSDRMVEEYRTMYRPCLGILMSQAEREAGKLGSREGKKYYVKEII